jgi:hypothetical protein
VDKCHNRTVNFEALPLALSLEADASIECQKHEVPHWARPTSKVGSWDTQRMEARHKTDTSTPYNRELKGEAVEEEDCELDSDVKSYSRTRI